MTVSHGSSQEITLEVLPASTLVGKVRQAGRPLANARVRANRVDDDEDVAEQLASMATQQRWWGGESGESDGDGDYRVEGLEPGTYTIAVTHESRAMGWTTSVEVAEGEVVANFDLPLCAVEGRVVDTEGRGVQGVEVRALPESQRFNGPDNDRGGGGIMGGGVDVVDVGVVSSGARPPSADRSVTDDQGNFRLEGLTAGAQLVVRADGDSITPAISEAFELEEDEVKSGIELVVEQAGVVIVETTPVEGGDGGFMWISVVATPAGQSLSQSIPEAVVAVAEGEEPAEASEVPVAPVTGFAFGGGDVKLTGMKPGIWKVVATQGGPGDGEEPKGETEVEVLPGETVTVEIVLQ